MPQCLQEEMEAKGLSQNHHNKDFVKHNDQGRFVDVFGVHYIKYLYLKN